MEALNREARTTLVLVTHDLALAERAHRIVRLAGGRLVADSGANGGHP
jgi:putative ABC transport system ATP-binding protein